MLQKLQTPTTVQCIYNHKTRIFAPHSLLWEGRQHKVTIFGYHHSYRQGKTMMHVFSVASPTLYFKILFNTDSLSWIVEEISDGEAD